MLQQWMLKCLWRTAGPALAVAALMAPSSAARALPMPAGLADGCSIAGCEGVHYNDANGHFYAFVAADGPSWAAAQSVAAGKEGYLATIADPDENAFIVSQVLPLGFTHKRQVWLGGFQGATATSPSADWHWINPEVWDYTDWTPGEPNDENSMHTGHEDHLTMWVHYYVAQATGFALDMRGMWNDEGPTSESNSPVVGYIVEWDGSPVPEPATALLGLLGVGLVARRARR